MKREPLKGQWGNHRLTTEKAEKALVAAGIPIDPIEWTDDDMWSANTVFNEAAKQKDSNK